jgi:hypothetical protein
VSVSIAKDRAACRRALLRATALAGLRKNPLFGWKAADFCRIKGMLAICYAAACRFVCPAKAGSEVVPYALFAIFASHA